MNQKFDAPGAHKVGGVLALLALVVMALGIGAMTYQSRVLHLTGAFWESFSLVVAFAPTCSTLVVAWYKLFAVSDASHDKWLWGAFGIDMLGISVQLLGVGLQTVELHDNVILMIRAVAFVFSGLALVAVALAAGTSGYRTLLVHEHQREMDLESAFDQNWLDAMNSPEVRSHMITIAKAVMAEKVRAKLGRRAGMPQAPSVPQIEIEIPPVQVAGLSLDEMAALMGAGEMRGNGGTYPKA